MTKQRLYKSAEAIQLPGEGCAGCGKCCRGMGDTIVLDPWDAAQLAEGLGKPFASLLEREADLHAEEGLILPHLRMQAETDSCIFLSGEGKCTIHAFRPGICRLYPLGRQYGETGVRYFRVPDSCKDRSENVRIDRWLAVAGGKAGLHQYEQFKTQWQRFTRSMKETVNSGDLDPETVRQLNVYLLQRFYLEPYPANRFFEVFYHRLQDIETQLRG